MKSVMVRLTSFAMILLFLPMQACSPVGRHLNNAVADVKEERFDLALPALERESEVGNRDAQGLWPNFMQPALVWDQNRAKANALLLCRQSPSCVAGKAEYYLAMDFLDGAGLDQAARTPSIGSSFLASAGTLHANEP
jgi:hypothetical protein